MKTDHFASWRANFFTGLAIVLPAVVSFVVIYWLFFTAANVTDKLLIFMPKEYTHESLVGIPGEGPMHWYWSLVALLLAILLIYLVGLLARNYLGKKLIQWADAVLLRVPLLNRIYGATKQVNEAFTSSGGKNSFKTVVMVEFPHPGMRSIGFLTSEVHEEIQKKATEKMFCVFIPTTPNPTSGFLVLVPEDRVTKLEMSVADGIKFIVSLGSISPDYNAHSQQKLPLTG